MSDPVSGTLIGLSVAATVASIAIGIGGAYQASEANKVNAKAATDQAGFEADQLRRRNERLLGSQRAAAAKSGLALDSGSYNDILLDSSVEGELDVQAAKYRGSIGANRYDTAATLGLDQAYASGAVGVGGALIGGANKGYNSYSGTNYQPIPRATAVNSEGVPF